MQTQSRMKIMARGAGQFLYALPSPHEADATLGTTDAGYRKRHGTGNCWNGRNLGGEGRWALSFPSLSRVADSGNPTAMPNSSRAFVDGCR